MRKDILVGKKYAIAFLWGRAGKNLLMQYAHKGQISL
jgi:hypothetical protein